MLATGSGGTHSGAMVGKTYYKSNKKILGISVKDKKNDQEEKVFKLAKDACDYIQCNYPNREDVVAFDDYVGEGYGVPTEGMKEAVKLMATKEAILLDPVYSGKCFDGLLDLINKKFNLTINNSSDIEKLFLSYNSSDIMRILSTPDIYICLVTNPKEDNYDFLVNPITLKMITNKDYHPSLISLEMAHNMYDLGLKNKKAVSYTHLTLPTNREV